MYEHRSTPRGLFILDKESYDLAYGQSQREQIGELVDVYAPPQTKESIARDPSVLGDMEIMFSGWGAPVLDKAFLESAPKLEAVFYAAGTIRQMMTNAAWERDIFVTSAYGVNAIPVAEFTFSQVIFCLKLAWQTFNTMNRHYNYGRLPNMPGAYGSTVGIITLGQIGRRVCEMLKQLEVRVLAYHPKPSASLANNLNVEFVSLEQLFVDCDVVSLHAPLLRETEGMIDGRLLSMMKYRASFINTAQGGVVNEHEMIEVLRKRDDLVAVLDVTCREPLESESPLWQMHNAVLFPHMSGSWDCECRRMGQCMVDELRQYTSGEPLKWQITRKRAISLA